MLLVTVISAVLTTDNFITSTDGHEPSIFLKLSSLLLVNPYNVFNEVYVISLGFNKHQKARLNAIFGGGLGFVFL